MRGLIAVALIVGVLVGGFGVSQFRRGVAADSNWQTITLRGDDMVDPFGTPDPTVYLSDWIKTIPGSCEIVPVSQVSSGAASPVFVNLLYRC